MPHRFSESTSELAVDSAGCIWHGQKAFIPGKKLAKGERVVFCDVFVADNQFHYWLATYLPSTDSSTVTIGERAFRISGHAVHLVSSGFLEAAWVFCSNGSIWGILRGDEAKEVGTLGFPVVSATQISDDAVAVTDGKRIYRLLLHSMHCSPVGELDCHTGWTISKISSLANGTILLYAAESSDPAVGRLSIFSMRTEALASVPLPGAFVPVAHSMSRRAVALDVHSLFILGDRGQLAKYTVDINTLEIRYLNVESVGNDIADISSVNRGEYVRLLSGTGLIEHRKISEIPPLPEPKDSEGVGPESLEKTLSLLAQCGDYERARRVIAANFELFVSGPQKRECLRVLVAAKNVFLAVEQSRCWGASELLPFTIRECDERKIGFATVFLSEEEVALIPLTSDWVGQQLEAHRRLFGREIKTAKI